MWTFFIIVPPGLETIAESEILWWHPSLAGHIQRHRGGLELQAELAVGFELNTYLKVPSRILLRLADFGCRDFPKLYKKMMKVDWAKWGGSAEPNWQVSSHRSRLAVKRRIQKTCADAFRKYWSQREEDEHGAGIPLTIYVRVLDDVVTVSLDTSGDHLHRRGYKPYSTVAPIRENLAAGLILALKGLSSFDEIAGIRLVDPMSGSGTFLCEAALLKSPVTMREFRFTEFPVYRTEKEADEVLRAPVNVENPQTFQSCLGWEVNEDAIGAARQNIERLPSVGVPVDLVLSDLFNFKEAVAGRNWVICNPPYGERLKVEGRLSDFYARTLQQIESAFAPERIGFLIPSRAGRGLRWPGNWKVLDKLELENGGLPVTFHIFTRIV